jgi:hypothetical protein
MPFVMDAAAVSFISTERLKAVLDPRVQAIGGSALQGERHFSLSRSIARSMVKRFGQLAALA